MELSEAERNAVIQNFQASQPSSGEQSAGVDPNSQGDENQRSGGRAQVCSGPKYFLNISTAAVLSVAECGPYPQTNLQRTGFVLTIFQVSGFQDQLFVLRVLT